MKYKHFLVTCFNLYRNTEWYRDKNNVTTLTSEWLEYRYQLFEKYCLPSIASQNNKDFIWFCLFDYNTPDTYKKLNESYKKICPNFIPCYLNREETMDLQGYLNQCIAPYLNNDTDLVITTRTDNDDSFAINAIDFIQKYVEQQNFIDTYAINMLSGMQYFANYGVSIPIEYKNNHFLTLVEKKSRKLNTIINIRHGKVDKYFNVQNVSSKKPLWLEVVHNNNVANDVRSTWAFNPISKNTPFELFGLDRSKIDVKAMNLFRYRVIIPKILKRTFKRFLFIK